MSPKRTYVAPATYQNKELVTAINEMISNALGGKPFCWGSLQINEDSVSELHTDKNNLGKSLIRFFGDFKGGTFTMADGSHKLMSKDIGRAPCIDGTKPHLSKAFVGKRFSVVAFLHSSWNSLDDNDLEELRELGFQFPYSPDDQVSGDEGGTSAPATDDDDVLSLPESVDSYTALSAQTAREPHSYESSTRVLLEYCCGPDSRLGCRSRASRGCHVIRLTREHDMSTQAGLDYALSIVQRARDDGKSVDLWGSIPCTGGCPFQRLNAKRGPKTRKKIAMHKRLFSKLFINYTKLADKVLAAGGKIAIEWPSQCSYWKDRRVVAFSRKHGLDKVSFHGCMFGLVSVAIGVEGTPIKKPWTVMTNCDCFDICFV